MKKIITTVIALIFLSGVSTYGKDKITYYHMFSKDAVSLPQSQMIAETLNKTFSVDFKPGLGCSTKTQIDEDKNIALIEFVTGRMWKSLQDKDGQCDIDHKVLKIIGTQSYFTNICVDNNSAIKTHQDFLKSRSLKIGFSTGSHMGFWLDQYVKQYGVEIKQVPFTNSNKQMLALYSGEIDVVTVLDDVADKHIKDGKLRCIAFGDPKASMATEKLFPKISVGLSSAPNVFVLAVKNVDEKNYHLLIEKVLEAKKHLDKNFPSNRFIPVGNDHSSIDADKIFRSATIDLYNLTKQIKTN
jgi:hypothetical protein